MKLRIKGNSLRYRLTRTEVERLSETGLVEEKITFGDSVLTYALCTTESGALSATFSDNRITVFLPSAFANEWVHSDKVGFDARLPLNGEEEDLYLLIEKDFTCLDNVEEDQSDNYPNPLLKNSL
jgi:hypothetical protein